jgi:hypothetical protein
MLRQAALLLNVLLVLAWTYLMLDSGIPTGEEIPIALLMLFAPAVSVMALLSSTFGEPSWLGLYLRRKRLEEQKKIDALSKG